MSPVVESRAGIRPALANRISEDHTLLKQEDVQLFLTAPLNQVGYE